MLRDLQRKWGLAYIFISHDLRVVKALSHKVMVMKAGDVVEAGDTAEMREKLLEVLFDSEGRLQLQRLESLLAVVENDESAVGAELLPVAGAGLKLLLGQEGRSIRERLLLTLVRDDRLNTEDLRGLLELLGRTFAPQRMVRRLRDQLFTRLNPLAA